MLGLRMLNTWTHCNLNFPLQIEFMQQIGIKFLVIIVNYFPSSCLENTKKLAQKFHSEVLHSLFVFFIDHIICCTNCAMKIWYVNKSLPYSSRKKTLLFKWAKFVTWTLMISIKLQSELSGKTYGNCFS